MLQQKTQKFSNYLLDILQRYGTEVYQDLVIARASVGVAHVDLIEHVIECLPIVHLAIQTA